MRLLFPGRFIQGGMLGGLVYAGAGIHDGALMAAITHPERRFRQDPLGILVPNPGRGIVRPGQMAQDAVFLRWLHGLTDRLTGCHGPLTETQPHNPTGTGLGHVQGICVESQTGGRIELHRLALRVLQPSQKFTPLEYADGAKIGIADVEAITGLIQGDAGGSEQFTV